jgi:hypothetical protein
VVGLALQQWVAAIENKEENTLEIVNPVALELPLIENVEWQNLIFQLYIHHSIKRADIYTLYAPSDKQWINQVLNAIKTSGICVQNERGDFSLVKEIRPYIENWFLELGYIK